MLLSFSWRVFKIRNEPRRVDLPPAGADLPAEVCHRGVHATDVVDDHRLDFARSGLFVRWGS
jgi:hypothetical protein